MAALRRLTAKSRSLRAAGLAGRALPRRLFRGLSLSIELCVVSRDPSRLSLAKPDLPESRKIPQQIELWHSTELRISGCISLPRTWGRTYEELHLRDFLVDFLHELDDEIHELVF